MSDTPRTDAFIAGREPVRLPMIVCESMCDSIAIGTSVREVMIAYTEHARTLERELAAALAKAAVPSAPDGMPEEPLVFTFAGDTLKHVYVLKSDYDALRQWAVAEHEATRRNLADEHAAHVLALRRAEAAEAEVARLRGVIQDFYDYGYDRGEAEAALSEKRKK